MAFNTRQLARIGGTGLSSGESRSIFALATTDSLATVMASGYFNAGTKRLRKGDIIHVMASQGGTVEHATLQVSSATGAATVTTALAAVRGVTAGTKIARGVASITGSGTVVTGLTTVAAIVATLQDDAALTGNAVTATIGDQAGAPAAGSVTIKVWKPTASGDVTPIAATAAKSVNWIAFGT